MPLLDLQRRGQQIGRIRLGEKYTTSGGREAPRKLETFRFTTGSRPAATAIAELFGGQVRPWQDELEVVTSVSEIGVTVPPRDQVISQWYEMWTAAGCQRRCDSELEQISGKPCLCAHLLEDFSGGQAKSAERSRLAKLNPPQACSVKTRVNVMIPDLPGLGVWRVDTGSIFAAMEMADSATLMQTAREHGVFLPAQLRIEQREIRKPGQKPRQFGVLVLEVLATFRQITSGALESAGVTAALPPAPGSPLLAIAAAGPPAEVADAELIDDEQDAAYKRAQQIADAVPTAGWEQFKALGREARDNPLIGEQHVCVDRENDRWEELLPWLEGLRDARTRKAS